MAEDHRGANQILNKLYSSQLRGNIKVIIILQVGVIALLQRQ